MVKYLAPLSSGRIFSKVGITWCSLEIALFSTMGPRHTLILPFGFRQYMHQTVDPGSRLTFVNLIHHADSVARVVEHGQLGELKDLQWYVTDLGTFQYRQQSNQDIAALRHPYFSGEWLVWGYQWRSAETLTRLSSRPGMLEAQWWLDRRPP